MLFERNKDKERRLIEEEGARGGPLLSQTGSPLSREAISGAIRRERNTLENDLGARLAVADEEQLGERQRTKLDSRFVATPEEVPPSSQLEPRQAVAYKPQPRQLTPEEQQTQYEAKLARSKRTELKTLEWMADRGLSGITQDDVDKFVRNEGIDLEGFSKEEQDERAVQAGERERTGDPRKRAAGIRAEMAVKSAMTPEESFRAMTDPKSTEAKQLVSVRKAANVIAGGVEDIGLSDLAALEQSQAKGNDRAGLRLLKEQVSQRVADGAQAASAAIQGLQESPEWAEMSVSEYYEAVNAEVDKLDPIQRESAMRSLVSLKPDLIKQKEKALAAAGAKKEEQEAQMGMYNKTALDMNEADFRNYLIDSGVRPEEANRMIDEALTEDSEGNKKHAEFIAEMRKSGVSVAYVTDDGVTVTTQKTPTAPKTLSVSGQTFSGKKQLDKIAEIAPVPYKVLTDIQAGELDLPDPKEDTVTNYGDGRAIANDALELMDADKTLGTVSAVRQAAETYKGDQTVDQILGATRDEIKSRLTERSEERASTQFAAQREIADKAIDETFMQGTQVDVEDVEQEIEAAMTLGGELTQDKLDEIADGRITRQLKENSKFVSEEKRTAARERIEMAIERGVNKAHAMIREAEAVNNAENIRREGLVYENPDHELRFEGVDKEPIRFRKDDLTEQSYLEAYDNAGSAKEKEQVIDDLIEHKAVVKKSATRRDELIKSLDDGFGWERATWASGGTVLEDRPLPGFQTTEPLDSLDPFDAESVLLGMQESVGQMWGMQTGLTYEDRKELQKRITKMRADNKPKMESELEKERIYIEEMYADTSAKIKKPETREAAAERYRNDEAATKDMNDWVNRNKTNLTDKNLAPVVARMLEFGLLDSKNLEWVSGIIAAKEEGNPIYREVTGIKKVDSGFEDIESKSDVDLGDE